MNKQELIESISHLPSDCSRPRPMIDKLTALELIKLLDEPQKVTVPQFVADWIEECKNDDFHLFGAMEAISFNRKKLDYWFREDDNMEIFARAWLDGYEIEQKKRYLVKAKGVYFNSCLIFEKKNKKWFFSSVYETDHQIGYHTKEELEQAGFGWVFDCEGMEVKAVEEEK